MSIVRTYTVFCDGEEVDGRPCPRWTAETTDGAVDARKEARRRGWIRRDGLDLCPFCKVKVRP